MKNYPVVCKFCQENIIAHRNNQKFCIGGCADKYYNMLKIKETFRLSEEDLKIWKRIHKK